MEVVTSDVVAKRPNLAECYMEGSEVAELMSAVVFAWASLFQMAQSKSLINFPGTVSISTLDCFNIKMCRSES